MKNTLKKVMVTIMAFALLVGTLSVPVQQVQAASKLTKADFKFTGMYKSGTNAVIKARDDWYLDVVNTIDEKAPKKCIKTKRGITLTATKKQVFKKYGKVTLKKSAKSSTFSKRLKKTSNDAYNLVKNEKCAVYSYKSGSNTYKLHFFFDKKETVNTIVVSKNC